MTGQQMLARHRGAALSQHRFETFQTGLRESVFMKSTLVGAFIDRSAVLDPAYSTLGSHAAVWPLIARSVQQSTLNEVEHSPPRKLDVCAGGR